MKKFIIHITKFTIVLLTINIILFFIGKKLYFGQYDIHSLENSAYLLSDSRGQALNDYTEKYGVHNFSCGSDSYEDMYRKTLYLIRNTEVKKIFISVDEHSLTSYRERKNNLDRSVIYCTPEDFGSFYEYFKQRYLKRYTALLRPEIAEVIKIYKFPSTKKPVIWSSRSEEDRNNRAEKRVRTNFPDDSGSEKLKISLYKIIDLCKKNDIELIGMKLPLTREYLKAAENKRGQADDILVKSGFEVLDLSELYIDNPEFFADQDHLNQSGAVDLVNRVFN